MTILEALAFGKLQIQNGSTTPQLDTEVLLANAFKKDRAFILSNPSLPLDKSMITIFTQYVKERATGKPIAYITKTKNFYGRDFYIDERVLVPRPETEELTELAINYLKQNPEIQTVIDIGTGSGCIAITIALELPEKRIMATDISLDALKIVQENQKKLCPHQNISIIQGDILVKKNAKNSQAKTEPENWKIEIGYSPLAIVSNLPYVPEDRSDLVESNVKAHEPSFALFSGKDGLNHYRRLFQQLENLNLNPKFMALEIMPGQEKITELYTPLPGKIKKDLAGLTRFAIWH